MDGVRWNGWFDRGGEDMLGFRTVTVGSHDDDGEDEL